MMSSMMRAHAPATTRATTTVGGRANRRAAMRVTTVVRAVSDASSVEASGDAAPAPPALESEVGVDVVASREGSVCVCACVRGRVRARARCARATIGR